MIDLWMLSVIVLGALIALGGSFLSHLSPRVGVPRRWLWLMLMVVSVALPVVLAVRPTRPPIESGAGSERSERLPVAVQDGARKPLASLGATDVVRPNRNEELLLAWAAASLLLAGIFTLSHRRIRRELAACQRRELYGSLVAVSPDFGPAAVGLLRSEVVLPEWVFDLPHDEQQLVLRHELEHIRAGDHFVLLAGVTLAVLMPWNLALWWQLRRLRVGMEVDCDARVAPALRDRPRYAELLLRARNRRKAHRLALALVPAPSALGERLLALLESAKLSSRQVMTWSVSAVACGVMVTRVPVPNLKPLLSAASAAATVISTGPAITAHLPVISSQSAPRDGAVPVRPAQGHPRYDSLIPVPIIGAPGHPRYDSLVPYVPGRPTMGRGGYVGGGVGVVRAAPPPDSTEEHPDHR